MMSYNDFMSKVRHWDNLTAKWLMRHFYLMFFQIILVAIFVIWFINTLNVIDLNSHISNAPLTEQLLMAQANNTTIIILLLLLNSFWMLFIFNGIQRLWSLMKDVNYNISKLRTRDKSNPKQQEY